MVFSTDAGFHLAGDGLVSHTRVRERVYSLHLRIISGGSLSAFNILNNQSFILTRRASCTCTYVL